MILARVPPTAIDESPRDIAKVAAQLPLRDTVAAMAFCITSRFALPMHFFVSFVFFVAIFSS
jgi:hypothetical protein